MTLADLMERELLDYAAYRQLLAAKAGGVLEPGDESHGDYFRLNEQRMRRVEKTYTVSPSLAATIRELPAQTWIVISETWCGDSAQNIPFIARMAEINPNITLRFLLRDKNLDVMDDYLTDGKRQIPKLIVFDEDGVELFQWGPRPREAQALFDRRKVEGIPLDQVKQELHLWYGRNRGAELEKEFCELLTRTADVACVMATARSLRQAGM